MVIATYTGSFLTNIGFLSLRNLLIQYDINYIIDLGENVVTDASVDSAILILKNNKNNNNNKILCSDSSFKYNAIDKNIFNIYSDAKKLDLAVKLEKNNVIFNHYINFSRGVEFGFKSNNISDKKIDNNYKPIICGDHIKRFGINFQNKYLVHESNNSSIYKSIDIYENPKILVRRIGNTIISAFDHTGFLNVCDVYNLQLKTNSYNLKSSNAILNSKLIDF